MTAVMFAVLPDCTCPTTKPRHAKLSRRGLSRRETTSVDALSISATVSRDHFLTCTRKSRNAGQCLASTADPAYQASRFRMTEFCRRISFGGACDPLFCFRADFAKRKQEIAYVARRQLNRSRAGQVQPYLLDHFLKLRIHFAPLWRGSRSKRHAMPPTRHMPLSRLASQLGDKQQVCP